MNITILSLIQAMITDRYPLLDTESHDEHDRMTLMIWSRIDRDRSCTMKMLGSVLTIHYPDRPDFPINLADPKSLDIVSVELTALQGYDDRELEALTKGILTSEKVQVDAVMKEIMDRDSIVELPNPKIFCNSGRTRLAPRSMKTIDSSIKRYLDGTIERDKCGITLASALCTMMHKHGNIDWLVEKIRERALHDGLPEAEVDSTISRVSMEDITC